MQSHSGRKSGPKPITGLSAVALGKRDKPEAPRRQTSTHKMWIVRFFLDILSRRAHISAMTDIDLTFIGRQLRSIQDDLRVQTAMLQRHDSTMRDVLDELRAIHQWMVGINDRVRNLEERP